MQYDENDFYTCPYCNQAKSEETSSRIDENHRFLRVKYNCGTEIEITWDGPDSDAKFNIVCVPQSKIN